MSNAKILIGYTDMNACDANIWTNTHRCSKIYCSIFVQKQVILFNLEFQWSSSGILSSKINLVFRKSLAQWAWIYFRKFHNLIGNEIYESFFLVWLTSSQPVSTVKKKRCSFLNPEHSILTDVKTNQNGFRSSGQDILAWRVQIPEVEPFDGF